MKSLINKILLLVRVMRGGRILVIERVYCKKRKQDKLVLWGASSDDMADEVKVLRIMADDIERDMKCRSLNFDTKRN